MRSRTRRLAAAVIALATWFPAGEARAASCWLPPVAAPVSDPFRAPACRWCPGNRGVEFASRVGDRVRAVATGRVVFAGRVAGVVYVVVRLADGRRVTYGNLLGEAFDVGDVVIRRQSIGRAAGSFHLGLREGDRYVDPGPFLGRLRYRARLIPIDGTQPIPAAAPRLVCDRR